MTDQQAGAAVPIVLGRRLLVEGKHGPQEEPAPEAIPGAASALNTLNQSVSSRDPLDQISVGNAHRALSHSSPDRRVS